MIRNDGTEKYTTAFFKPTNEKLNIIFLDWDGVMVTGRNADSCRKAYEKGRDKIVEVLGEQAKNLEPNMIGSVLMFSPVAVAHLKTLIQTFDAKIVLSNGSRYNDRERSRREIGLMFKLWELDRHLIDSTPWMSNDKTKEISAWLEENKAIVNNFVILDDCDFGFSSLFPDHFVEINGSQLLEERDIEKAKSIFSIKRDLERSSVTMLSQLVDSQRVDDVILSHNQVS